MDNTVKEKLAKVYELVNNGSTEGERAAAKIALDKLMKKYGLDKLDIADLSTQKYEFKYTTNLEVWLLERLTSFMLSPELLAGGYRSTFGRRAVILKLTHIDYVTLDSAYEYFRRHLKAQWKKVCAPAINRCRSSVTKRAKREQLEPLFFGKYVIASKLYKEGEVSQIDLNDLSQQEIKNRLMMQDVDGGKYNKQVTNGLLIG